MEKKSDFQHVFYQTCYKFSNLKNNTFPDFVYVVANMLAHILAILKSAKSVV